MLKFFREFKRISFDLFLFLGLTGLMLALVNLGSNNGVVTTLFGMNIPTALEVIIFKGTLISAAIIHAHITRKLILPKTDWTQDNQYMLKIAIISMYALFIFGYTRGG